MNVAPVLPKLPFHSLMASTDRMFGARSLILILSLPWVAAFSTPQVCTFASIGDCNSYTAPSCTPVDQLPSTVGSCVKNAAPQLLSSSGQVCATYTNCSALTQSTASGDQFTANGQAYAISSGTTLIQCPDGGCTKSLPAGTTSNKVQIGSNSHTLQSSTLTGILFYVVVGNDAYITTDNATFYKSVSNPPSLGSVSTNMGKEVFGSTSTPQSSTFLYAPSTTDNFDTSAAVCNLAFRFQQGDAATFGGYSVLNFKTTTAPFTITVGSVAGSSLTSTECNTVKNNANGSSRYRMTFRVFTDSSGNGVAKLNSNGDLYKRVSGSWTLVTDTAGCLANGMTYFKVSNVFTVYQTSTCWLNAGVTVTGSPMYNFTYGALTLNASATDLSSQTCFQNGTASYKLNNTLTNPTLFRFSSTSCAANPTVDATTRLTNLTAGCSSLNANDYAYNNSAILKVVSTSFSCSTPDCLSIGDCQTNSCLYSPGQMAGNVNCTLKGGVAMGMIYVRDFTTSTDTTTTATTTAVSTTLTTDATTSSTTDATTTTQFTTPATTTTSTATSTTDSTTLTTTSTTTSTTDSTTLTTTSVTSTTDATTTTTDTTTTTTQSTTSTTDATTTTAPSTTTTTDTTTSTTTQSMTSTTDATTTTTDTTTTTTQSTTSTTDATTTTAPSTTTTTDTTTSTTTQSMTSTTDATTTTAPSTTTTTDTTTSTTTTQSTTSTTDATTTTASSTTTTTDSTTTTSQPTTSTTLTTSTTTTQSSTSTTTMPGTYTPEPIIEPNDQLNGGTAANKLSAGHIAAATVVPIVAIAISVGVFVYLGAAAKAVATIKKHWAAKAAKAAKAKAGQSETAQEVKTTKMV